MALSRICDESKTNVIYINTQGFIGKIRLQAYDHNIIESKPMGNKLDLRILKPFKYLEEFCNDHDLQKLSSDPNNLAHVPYVVILRKALDVYKQGNEGKIP